MLCAFILSVSSSALQMLESHTVAGLPLLLKRDDLGAAPAGNKRRKLHHWLSWPSAQLAARSRIVSIGGNQSNAMLAIAQMSARSGIRFDYVTRTLPRALRSRPAGNIAAAIALGMRLHEFDAPSYSRARASIARRAAAPRDRGAVFIAQGAAQCEAADGFGALAAELRDDAASLGVPMRELIALVPCGTGASALFLSQSGVRVLAVPCVGGAEYLAEQMRAQLGDAREGATASLPPMLDDGGAIPFAKPHADMLRVWGEWTAATGGVAFDLIYAARAFLALEGARRRIALGGAREGSAADDAVLELERGEARLLFVHNGGTAGNKTMLERYAAAGFCCY
jgi:1-aminocyclopropane-1-carboxylate deaminase/D-cysteine desulfhydrase-like pyridoxal-dependent ACC family enzyme